MKIIIISAATSNHTIRWCNSMSDRGHEVLLVSRADQRDEKNHISHKVKIKYLKYGGGLGYYLNVPELRRICSEFQPDVVNAQYAAGYGTLARLSKVKRLVLSCYGSDVYSFPYKSRFNHWVICKNLKYANAIASTSYAMANQVRKVLNDNKQPITVTPFGVDINRFRPTRNRIDNKSIVIGIVKYLEPIYDIPLLINAHAILCDKLEVKPVLKIYGDGSLRNELEQLVDKLGTSQYVQFLGIIPNTEVPVVLNEMDVFVNCSIQESFGVAVVEAMACELPVVVTDTEGYKEVVDDGINGIVLKDRNPETMSSVLYDLIINPSLRAQYGKCAREKVLKEYNWEKNVDTMESLYRKVASNNG